MHEITFQQIQHGKRQKAATVHCQRLLCCASQLTSPSLAFRSRVSITLLACMRWRRRASQLSGELLTGSMAGRATGRQASSPCMSIPLPPPCRAGRHLDIKVDHMLLVQVRQSSGDIEGDALAAPPPTKYALAAAVTPP